MGQYSPVDEQPLWMLKRRAKWAKRYTDSYERAFMRGDEDISWEMIVAARERQEIAESLLTVEEETAIITLQVEH